MTSRLALLFHAALAFAACAAIAQSAPTPSTVGTATHLPTYVDGKLQLPADYREWIYVTSGMDMSYRLIAMPGHHMFDNVFVNPEAYRVFKQTGTWPDKTMMVLEARGARDKGSINQHGLFQDGDLMGVEVHVKDSTRFEGGWAFFAFDDDKPAAEIKHSADCYACHRAHAAVDTTFVQFYPTLLPIAKTANTLSASYLEDLKKPD
jgi:Cytochrome P460